MTEPVFDPIATRRDEVADYQRGIDLYTSIASGLPSVWPEHLAHLKGAADKHAAISGVDDLNDVVLVSQLWAHDDAQAAIRSNMVEQAKARAILSVIEQRPSVGAIL